LQDLVFRALPAAGARGLLDVQLVLARVLRGGGLPPVSLEGIPVCVLVRDGKDCVAWNMAALDRLGYYDCSDDELLRQKSVGLKTS